MVATGFYIMQYAFDRAYGNYLGLCRLGRFMAKQLDVPLSRVVCISSHAAMGKAGKEDLRRLASWLDKKVHGNKNKTA
jgi:hypothetical protein